MFCLMNRLLRAGTVVERVKLPRVMLQCLSEFGLQPPIQLPDNALGEAEDGRSAAALPPVWGTWMQVQAAGFHLEKPQPYSVAIQGVNPWIQVSFSLSLPICHSDFKSIN